MRVMRFDELAGIAPLREDMLVYQPPHLGLPSQSDRRHFKSLPEVRRRQVDLVFLAAVQCRRGAKLLVEIGASAVIELDPRLPSSLQGILLRGLWHLVGTA